jgi:putative ABC transport system permease protein
MRRWLKMNFLQAFRMAVKSILSSKMRSFLTMLGIIIGIFSVIVLIAMGEGTKKDISDSISSMGTNLITINLTGNRDRKITTEEINNLKEQAGIEDIAPIITSSVTAKVGNRSMQTSLEGSDVGYTTIRNINVQEGRFISDEDISGRLKVAVIGVDIVDQIFEKNEAVGKTITLNGTNFTVIGVLESKGTSMLGSNDNKIIIPITTAQRFLRNTVIRTFYVQATSPEMVDIAQAQLELFLTRKTNGESNAYRVLNQTELLETRNQAANRFTMMLAGIAAISLVVGGIGIMNIMLVSVTERTREIGIRKAIGAKRKNILTQFLIEALCVSGLGGVLGVALGFIGCEILPKLLKQSVIMSGRIVFLSFAFSAAVGIVFGLYPANKASKLKPIDALRYE